MTNPYILFGGNSTPRGGALDFVSAWGSADECEAEAGRLHLKWWQATVLNSAGEMSVVKASAAEEGPKKKSSQRAVGD